MNKLFPCQCGCGKLAPLGKAFIQGHDEIYDHYRHWIVDYEKGIDNHHYIYDHANPEKYTTKMTRSKHMQLHGWMRKSGIVVPHINEDAGEWTYNILKKHVIKD